MALLARYRSAAIVAVLSVLLALAVGSGVARSHRSAELEGASTQANVVTAGLLAATTVGMALVDAVGGLFDASEQVTPEEFSAFAGRSLDETTFFRAVQYSAVVTGRDRAAFEKELAARGFPWGIRDPSERGPVPAPERDRYVAVTMQEPSTGNEVAYGLDISYRPAARDLVDSVTASGQPGIGGWATIVQSGEPALHIYAPVYAKGAALVTPVDRANALVGIAGTIFLYESALAAIPVDPATEFAVLDAAAIAGEPSVLFSSSGTVDDPVAVADWPSSRTVHVGGLQLVVAARPLPGAAVAGVPPWLAGLLVLLVGLMLAAYLVRTAEQRRLTEATEQLRAVNQRLQYLSDHDSLTGLLRRDAAERVLEGWMATARPGERPLVAALLIDIDRFGLVNSTWGHPVGDAVLRQLADRLRPFVDDSTIIARLGSDEFLMLRRAGDLTALRLPGTMRAIQRIIAEPVTVGESRQSFTTSIGVALYPTDADDADRLIAKADAAVRSAQSLGSGQIVVFNSKVEAAEAERIGIEREVSIALREPDAPFHMVYQPQVRMTDGQCVGLEALVRWPAHPAGPGVFIPVAERSGLIVPLGRYVARAVVKQVRDWRDAGVQVPLVSFNVSADQFVEDFATRLLGMLDVEGIDPRQLEVEVTEYSALRDAARSQLERLRRSGMRVAIDDFGTGFSSLARLATLPVDRLKIDRSFIVGLPDEASSVEVVRTIADLSRSLGLEVVCEGVQTDAQADLLLSLGLEIAQGFRYARPMPPTQIPRFLRFGATVGARATAVPRRTPAQR